MAQARGAAGLTRLRAATLLLALALATACSGLPKDPEGTLERVEGGTMRIGITDSEPWALFDGSKATGVEPRILEMFAEELDAEIEWVQGAEADLMGALEYREVDAVIGGLTSTNPWSGKVSFTHPYITTSVVVGVPTGGEMPEDIAGVEVAVERGTEAAGVLEKTDANVVYVDDVADVADVEGAVAVDNWLLDELSLEDTGVTLIETDHVMATPLGENAWQVRLERFLLTHEQEIKDLLEEEGKP